MRDFPFLQVAARTSALRSSRSEEAVPLALLEKLCEKAPDPFPFLEGLKRPPGDPVRIIAEIKAASPSCGPLVDDLDPAFLASRYQKGGAAAISVLTEPFFFRGSLEHLRAAAEACSLPVLRKDFVVSDYQVWEARSCGASAVLLIAALHDPRTLKERINLCRSLGMEALVEVSDRGEVEIALQAGAEVIGANNRDLETLEVDMGRCVRILGDAPEGVVRVFESGFTQAGQIAEAGEAGADAVLVGAALMRSEDPEAALMRLAGVRVSRRGRSGFRARGREERCS